MKKLMIVMALMAMVGAVNAARIGTAVDQHISSANGNDHWTTAGNPYYLVGDIVVLPNEALTIDAGVIVASYVTDDGSLAVSRDGDIYINGTAENPVIFTSVEDMATWTGTTGITRTTTAGVTVVVDQFGTTDDPITEISGSMGDPDTGFWRPTCNEWGSLAIMGNAYISSTYNGTAQGKLSYPDAGNNDVMEGLQEDLVNGITDAMIRYGGGDDDDSSGSISYLSLRYGGREIALANELNGMSLGAVGRGTDIHHVEVMNNLDDGIEIWGGTVELDHVSIWNIGDDSFDIDQGWRGKASNGLIVQGYCDLNGSQGSGQGDNCFETDGAEDSDAQPVTTATISNFTAIGDPYIGDQGTAWRAGARIQYDDCIWMDIGDQLIKNDNVDGDGSAGYGYDPDAGGALPSTLTWAEVWSTTYDAAWNKSHALAARTSNYPHVSGFTQAQMQAIYPTQTSGNLAQVTDSVFHNINSFGQAVTVGALADTTTVDAANGTMGNIIKSTSPVQTVARDLGSVLVVGYAPVKFLNPLPAEGVTAGGFSGCDNWLLGWTAADAYNFVDRTTAVNGNADMNCDGEVDLIDLSNLSSQWLQ